MNFRFMRCAIVALVGFGALSSVSAPSHAESLKDSISGLLKNHQRIQAARADVASASEGVQVARKAYLPTLDITTFYGFEEQRKDNADNTHMPTRELDFKVTQLMYDFGSTASGKEQAELAVSQAEAVLSATEQGLILESISAHLGLISAFEILNFAKGSEANIKRQTEMEDARVQRGSGFSTDVLQAKTQLAGAVARLIQNEGRMKTTLNRYRAVFGDAPEDIGKMRDPRLPLELLPKSVDEAIEDVKKSNPQLAASRLSAAIAREDVTKTRVDEFLPTLDVVGEHTLKIDDGGTAGAQQETLIKLEAGYDFNLGFTAVNTLKASQQTHLASVNQFGDTRDLVEEQARNSWDNLQTAQSNAAQLHNQADIASEFLDLARRERQLGNRSLMPMVCWARWSRLVL